MSDVVPARDLGFVHDSVDSVEPGGQIVVRMQLVGTDADGAREFVEGLLYGERNVGYCKKKR